MLDCRPLLEIINVELHGPTSHSQHYLKVKMSTARLDRLKAIEAAVQAKWEPGNVFHVNAPAASEEDRTPKFFVTAPCLSVNGKLHIGDGHSLSKAEFGARYWRMKGRRSLYPIGLHTTGSAITHRATALANEMEGDGNPPQLPPNDARKANVSSFSQWRAMKNMGLSDSEIPAFADAHHWLKYFPSLAVDDLKATGVHVDWRRSFITTDRNPFYDSFIRWQFEQLRAGGYLTFGRRYSISSPSDGLPCSDQDRASGEGVQPQEYALVKLKVQGANSHSVFAPFADIIGNRDVILPAVTLRAETVVGQTNCWVSSKFTYRAYAVTSPTGKQDIFLMTAHAARNLCFQKIPINGVLNSDPEPLFEIEGIHMVGLPLSAPYCQYETIYSLPLSSISADKGTGIFMSAPSCSCDDYINLRQLAGNRAYREKSGVKDEWVTPFELVPVFEICDGELGRESVRLTVEKLGITSLDDADKLDEARMIVGATSFYQGVMVAGPFNGCKVAEAKVRMMEQMVENEVALRYFEPARKVMSRRGEECVVAFCDQWFIEYGEEDWKKVVVEHVKKMDIGDAIVRSGLEGALDWLSQWPCSHTFGLGTTLPCDASNSMIIDSLSDSTVHTAYCTVAHFFHGATDGNSCLDASAPNQFGITPEMMTSQVWNYVMRGTGSAEECNRTTGISARVVEQMRAEFSYWYPVDLHIGDKDLIQNHLTMFLYNHAAIWPTNSELWPRGISCCGRVLVNGQKVSTALGNRITLRQAIDMFGADCTRLAFADAGDGVEDANFVTKTAEVFIMRLTTLIDQCKELVAKKGEFRSDGYTIFDKIFANVVHAIVGATDSHYASMNFRMALGSAFFELTNEFNRYKLASEPDNMHVDLVCRYTTTITLLLQPLAPHVCEHIWTEVLGEAGCAVNAPFPAADPIDYSLHVTSRLIYDLCREIRLQAQPKNAEVGNQMDEVCVYVATTFHPWQVAVLRTLKCIYVDNSNSFPVNTTDQVMANGDGWLTKELMPSALAFVAFVKENTEKYGDDAMCTAPCVNDAALLNSVSDYIARATVMRKVRVLSHDDETHPEHKAARSRARPGEPSVAFPPASNE